MLTKVKNELIYLSTLRRILSSLKSINNDESSIITKKISGNHIVLYSDVDGNFPNHHPDPTNKSTLKILSKKMKDVKADIGIAFDGDGDRIGIIDKNGRHVAGDLLTAYLCNSIKINSHINQTVILDIKSSLVAFDKILSFGLSAEIGKTGHSNIKKRIKENEDKRFYYLPRNDRWVYISKHSWPIEGCRSS